MQIKPKTIKPLENLGDLFLRYNIESMIHKKKIDTLDIIKINICSSKDTAYKMSIDRWMHKEDVYNGILLSHKKNKIMPFVATWIQLEIIILKWSKSERERQTPNDITYMWNLKYGKNEPIYKTETDSQT